MKKPKCISCDKTLRRVTQDIRNQKEKNTLVDALTKKLAKLEKIQEGLTKNSTEWYKSTNQIAKTQKLIKQEVEKDQFKTFKL